MSVQSLSRAIGIIGKPHGVRGYVYVRMFTDYPDSVQKNSILYLDEKCTCKTRLENVKFITSGGARRTIFKLSGYDGIKEAEQLRNKVLYRNVQDWPELEQDTFWIDELNGCEVFLSDGTFFGIVEDVEKHPYNDNLLIRTGAEGISTIPMFEEYIDNIDVKKKRIILKKLPEYI